MSRIRVAVRGQGQFYRALRKLDRAAGGEVARAVGSSAKAVAARARLNAPVGTHDQHQHPRGQLQGDITDRHTKGSLVGFAGVPKESPSAAYAPVQEFGDKGRNIEAQPYLFPAAEAEKSGHVRRIRRAVRRSLAEVALG